MPRKPRSFSMPVPDKRCPYLRPRCWFVTPEGELIRTLSWQNYAELTCGSLDPSEPRSFMMRLAPDDPRPLGRRVFCGHFWTADQVRAQADWHRQMPIGVWHQIAGPGTRRNPFIAGLLTETAVTREEAA